MLGVSDTSSLQVLVQEADNNIILNLSRLVLAWWSRAFEVLAY